MASRPIFVPYTLGNRLVLETEIEFKWNPGLAPTQKKKNVEALHAAANLRGIFPILEVSSKSELELGMQLSAFNLQIELYDGRKTPLECAFQGSKVFESGGPYTGIYRMTSREAKKDERLLSSGRIVAFNFEGIEFPNEPKTAFYDWLYAKALASNHDLAERLEEFAGFSDIEFNPKKSINSQARSCALFVSLHRKGLLNQAISSPMNFIATVSEDSFAQPYSSDSRQGELF